MDYIPADIWNIVFSLVPQKSLLECRLVCKYVGSLATAWAFRHIRLEAMTEPRRFQNIAEAVHLRSLVREITFDSWTDFLYYQKDSFRRARQGRPAFELFSSHEGFFSALPFLRFYSNARKLNIRFDTYEHRAFQTRDIRSKCRRCDFYVLSIILRCLNGSWTEQWQDALDSSTEMRDPTKEVHGRSHVKVSPGLIEIDTVTISNLDGFDDAHLTSSKDFSDLFDYPYLKELKLLVSTPSVQQETCEFLEALPRTWLRPPVADNLRVLSLYCTEYWGWHPKMDFRTVSPKAISAFPNLEVLALGNYVFSHQWQVDWIASLGCGNGKGGLKELYLDDCPIMWRARVWKPLTATDTPIATGNGNSVLLSNEGYPDMKDMLEAGADLQLNDIEVLFPLRWSHILSQWQETMANLKVFKMGHGGSWDDASAEVVKKCYPEIYTELPEPKATRDYIIWERDRRRLAHPFTGTAFMNYDSPSPPDDMYSWKFPGSDDLRGGIGLHQKREHVLPYVYFDVALSPQWYDRDERRKLMDEDRHEEYYQNTQMDEEALADFGRIIQARK
ncbi:hypothetical protein F5Y15DRAFT_389420 [Xylariaceae sp. FL0016]|nr:hypothetical protein F5Y15DRAFT_389420 [Xylariaceae sp. FL0016]